MSAPVGLLRAAGLLARLRLVRIKNQFRSLLRYRMGSPDRKAASRISPGRSAFVAMTLIMMFMGFATASWQTITNIETRWRTTASPGEGAADASQRPERTRARSRDAAAVERGIRSPERYRPAPGSVMAAGMLADLTTLATLILLAALFAAIASRDLVRADWDVEWLITLPLPLPTLIGAMVLERAIAGSFGFIFLSAFLSALAVKCGWGVAAPLLGVALTMPVMFLTAIVQIVADTSLRLVLAPARLRNLQAVASLLVPVPLIVVLSLASPANLFVLDRLRFAEGGRWLPGGLLVEAVASGTAMRTLFVVAILIAEVAAVVAAGAALTGLLMRGGVVAAGVREGTARRPGAGLRDGAGSAPLSALIAALLSPVQRRDLRLLCRDRTLLVQTLVLPVMTVGIQIVIRGGDLDIFGFRPTPAVAAVAFYLAAVTLMQPAFRTMASEGRALWVLYCLPQPLERIVLHKAALWGGLALLYPLAIFTAVIASGHAIPVAFMVSIPVVLLGVPVFAVIGTALGVFAFDPLALDENRRVRVSHLYVFMMLGSFYAYAIFAPAIWPRVALMVLTALVAMALWQKARDHFEYLLDPASAPPSRVSLSDGLIAALAFFVLQAVIDLFLTEAVQAPLDGPTIWFGFTVAGAVTFGVVRFIYWRSGTAGVPVLLSGYQGTGSKGVRGVLERLAAPLAWGLSGGAAAAACGIIYLKAASALELMPTGVNGMLDDPDLPYWLAALAILAAPVFEEFIFRGLIFQGLRRWLGVPAAALASAAIFGLVHPPAAALPVAAMGLVAALVYARTGALIAPMLVHALYNAVVLAWQWHAVFDAGLHS